NLVLNGAGSVSGTWTMETVAVNGVMTLDANDIALYDAAPTFTAGSNQIPSVKYVDDAITSGTGAMSLTGLSDVSSATATAGRLLVSNGTTWDSLDSLYVDPVSGNVGIGTTGPIGIFDVAGTNPVQIIHDENTNNGKAYLRLSERALDWQGGYIMYDGAVNVLNIGVHAASSTDTADDVNAISILRSSGNVGIGTTSPNDLLHVVSTSDPSIRIGNSTVNQADSGKIVFYESSVGTEHFYLKHNGQYNRFHIGSLEAGENVLTIKRETGNIGIGTTAAPVKLYVNGDVSGVGSWTMETVAVNGVMTLDADDIALYDAAPTFTAGSNQIPSVKYVDDAITSGTGAMSLTGLSDVSSATATAGRLLVSNGSMWDSLDSLYVDPVNGNVGIGTDSPGTDFVVKPSSPDNQGIAVRESDDGNDAVRLNGLGGKGEIKIYDAGVLDIEFDPDGPSYIREGNVGIGTTAPSQSLDLIGSLELEDTTTSTTGVIYKGANRFIHTFHHPTGGGAVPVGYNTFVGIGSGNFTTGSTATQTWHGSYNTVVGYQALDVNTTGSSNTVAGYKAMSNNTTGTYNTANGSEVMFSNTTGSTNTANGLKALRENTTGSGNIAFGMDSGRYHADGSTLLTDAENSIYIGFEVRGFDNDDNNSIVIGANAVGLGANTVVLGNDSIVTTALKGNVGIGTNAPTAKLDVNGSGNVSGTWTMETVAVNGVMTLDDADIALYDGAPTFTAGSNQIPSVKYVDDAITSGT
ncbi:hypothetical protein ACFL49_03700, partial [Candidatus Omnitrophota bacterium]